MRIQTKLLVLLVAVLLLLGVVGCTERPAEPTGDTVMGTGGTDGSGSTGSTEKPGSSDVSGSIGELAGTIFIAGNHEWVRASSRESEIVGEQGIYFVDGQIFSYYDISSGLKVALCSKAGCLHGDAPGRGYEDCDGYGNLHTGEDLICVWNGSVYYQHEKAGGDYLCRCSATGTDHITLGPIGTRYTQDKQTFYILKDGVVDGYWYYHARVNGFERDPETGVNMYRQVLEYIARVDLATGKETILLEDRENYMMLMAVSPYGVLYTTEEENDESNPIDIRKIALKCWNAETGKIGTLFEKSGGTVTWVGNNKVECWSYTKDHGYSFDVTTGETRQLEGFLVYWGGGYARFVDGNGDSFISNLKTGEKLPSQFDYKDIQLESSSELGCVLKWNIMDDGGSADDRRYTEGRYCYVAYEDLADGLQESDLLCYRTVKYG